MRVLPPRHRSARSILTVPATRRDMVEKAVTKSNADLVMLDLEDSTPRDQPELLEAAIETIAWAFDSLDWGKKLRFFRPRGADLDPGFTDVAAILDRTKGSIDGLVYPKCEAPEEIRALTDSIETRRMAQDRALEPLRIHVLIESVRAERDCLKIAAASPNVSALVLGAFDWWSSMGLATEYAFDHPLVDQLRGNIARAAAEYGIPAIAEMSTNFPTKDKSDTERKTALDELRAHAERARMFGFSGKWVGIPSQIDVVHGVFTPSERTIARARENVRAFREAEAKGLGAIMLNGRMADRATDRVNRVVVENAIALGLIDELDALS